MGKMKKLIILIIILLFGYFVFDLYMKSNTPEIKIVRSLEREFRRAVDRYITAMRHAAEPGGVIISEPERAENEIRVIRAKLQEIIVTLTEQKALERARKLQADIKTFCQKNQID